MRRRSSPGIRTRVLLVLLVVGGGAALSLVLVFRTLVLPTLVRLEGERVLAMTRSAVISAPTEPREWLSWVNRLNDGLEGAEVFLIHSVPGTQAFRDETFTRGVNTERAIKAYETGEVLVVPGVADFAEPGGFLVMARLSGRWGGAALLVLRRTEGGVMPTSGSIWALWLLFVLLTMALAMAGGYLASWFLLVRPASAASATLSRALALGPMETGTDLASVRDAAETLSRLHRESREKAERLAADIKRMRTDLKGAQGSLLRAEKLASVGQLAAGIAHEIGNPIGIILGLSEVLKDGPVTDEEVRKFAGQIHGATMRVHGIIRDLLAFARPAREEGDEADVEAVMTATAKLLEPQKRFREMAVAMEAPKRPLVAEIRSSQLQQVLLNLMINAADATGGKGRVRVRAWAEDRWVLIAVADDGTGIPEEVLPRVFDPFFSTKAPGEGTGLGLWITAQVVEANGGEITVESEVGRGSCFTVRLWRKAGKGDDW